MLNITVSGSSAGVWKYFDGHLRKDEEGYGAVSRERPNNYYIKEHGESEGAPGVWGGKGAAMLRLSGEVKKEDFHALCENRKPGETGERLTKRDKANRRPGYDFTFNAPKSVSLLVALAGDERLREAFHHSVHETMTAFQQEMKTRVRRNAESRDRVTGNMVWAKFDHMLARPVGGVSDPHMHSHVYVFNATYDQAEERWKAGQFGDLKRDGPYFEAVFHSSLSRSVVKLGYEIERNGKYWEISGVPRELIEKFSRRTEQVEAAAKSRGVNNPKQKAELAKYTRAGKEEDIYSQPERENAWRSRLTNPENDFFATLREASLIRANKQKTSHDAEIKQALDFAKAHCFERKSVVSERELHESVLRAGLGILEPAAMRIEIERRIAQGRLLVAESESRRSRLVTTREALQEEKRMVEFAVTGRDQHFPLAPYYRIGHENNLTEEQRAAVEFIANNRDRVFAVQGCAGTGKTTLLKEAKRAVESGGNSLRAFAPTSGATDALRNGGFENAHTVARLLIDPRIQDGLRGQVLLIDEAGLLGSKTLRRIFDVAEKQRCRVLLVGDTKQHKSVERGDALRILIEQAAIKPIEVTKIQRQQSDAFREIVKDISEREIETAFDKLDRAGLITEISDNQQRHRSLATEYLHAIDEGKTALVVSPTHVEGRELTQVIREEMRTRGLLANEGQKISRLESQNLTEAERGLAHNYQPGLVVQFHRRAGDFRRGDRAIVQEVDDAGRVIVARDFGPIKVTDPLPLEKAASFTLYRREFLEIAAGDLIRITQNGKSLEGARINNGDVFQVKEITERGDLKLENERTLSGDYEHLDHGYCLTSHAAQGKTVDRTFNAVGEKSLPAVTFESFYVTNSRSREFTKTYTHDVEEYREAVTGERQRMSALELAGREQNLSQGKSPERNREITAKESPNLPAQDPINRSRTPTASEMEPTIHLIEHERDHYFER